MEPHLSTELGWAIRHFEFELLLDNELLTLQRPLNQHDSFKLDKILDDLLTYLSQLKHSLLAIQNGKDGLEWFGRHRATVIKLLDIQKSVDDFVTTILLVPLVMKDGVLTAKLKRVSLILIDCKLALLTVKRKTDIVANYMEIKGQIIDGLVLEVLLCTEMFKSHKQQVVASELPEDISLEQVTGLMKLNDISQKSMFHVRSVTFPVFSDLERETNLRFEALERRLDPIYVSMDFLDQRVQAFNSMCGTIFPSAIVELNKEFGGLRKKWEHFLAEFVSFKKQTVDTRWNRLILFLIEDILQRSLIMITEIGETDPGSFVISDEFGTAFKACSNAITLIHKAFMENVVYDPALTQKYNDTLLPRWKKLNLLLSNDFSPQKPTGLLVRPFSEKGYRPLKTARGRTPPPDPKPERPASLLHSGINLGLDVNPSPTVPFSIAKTDRIVDLNIDTDLVPKTNIQAALLGLADPPEVPEEDDLATLVHATPVTSSEDHKSDLWSRLRAPTTTRSKLPIMVSKYSQAGFPIIKKMFLNGYKPTRIPSISPLNAVFISPDRRPPASGQVRAPLFETPVGYPRSSFAARRVSISDSTPKLVQTALRSPPVFNLTRPSQYGDRSRRVSSSDGSISGEEFFQGARSRSSSLRLKADKMSLVGMNTPKLSFQASHLSDYSPDQYSLRSTSPERPESSIGSRFDELHLTQPLKPSKKTWR